MKVKEESEKVGLKLSIQKTKIMASDPITSWQIDRKTMEIVTNFIFLGSKITADGDCSHEIKRRLLLGRKAMTNLDCILKNRDITLPTKVHLVKAVAFPVIMYGCESWTIKKVEHWRIDAFELWCWRRLLRIPWTARTSNQSILREISPEYSLEGLVLKLKPQYFGHLMWRTDSMEKILMLGKVEGRRRWGWRERDGRMASPTRWTLVWASSRVGDGHGSLACSSPWGCKEPDMTEQWNWTEFLLSSFLCSYPKKRFSKLSSWGLFWAQFCTALHITKFIHVWSWNLLSICYPLFKILPFLVVSGKLLISLRTTLSVWRQLLGNTVPKSVIIWGTVPLEWDMDLKSRKMV